MEIFNEKTLPKNLVEKHEDKLKPEIRGFGYWVWKPYIINECLKEMDAGDILVYTDIGCHLNGNGLKRFHEYVDIVSQNNLGILAFKVEGHFNRVWIKGDTFDYFGLRQNTNITNDCVIAAGDIMIVKNKASMDFVERWIGVFDNRFDLVDDSPSKS